MELRSKYCIQQTIVFVLMEKLDFLVFFGPPCMSFLKTNTNAIYLSFLGQEKYKSLTSWTFVQAVFVLTHSSCLLNLRINGPNIDQKFKYGLGITCTNIWKVSVCILRFFGGCYESVLRVSHFPTYMTL